MTNSLSASALFLAAALFSLPAVATESANAELKSADGKPMGKVILTQTPNGVLVVAQFSELPAGTHALHFHEKGVCEPPFDSAGDHFNPTDAKHGVMTEGGFHAGDMPNINVPASGELRIEVLNAAVTLGDGKNSLLDQDGSAIIVHAGPDDYRSDPAGQAGDRIACGVIE